MRALLSLLSLAACILAARAQTLQTEAVAPTNPPATQPDPSPAANATVIGEDPPPANATTPPAPPAAPSNASSEVVTTVEAPVTVPALVTDASTVNTTVAATAPSNASSTTPAAEDASSEGEAVTATIMPEEASENGPANTTSASSTNTTHTNMTVSDGEAEGVMASMIDFQTQLYILSATFGGVIFLLIILVLTLALSVARIKEQLQERLRDERASRRSVGSRETCAAYENGAFSGNGHASFPGNERSVDGDDLSRLGYTTYTGGARDTAYKVSDSGHEDDIPLSDIRTPGSGGNKPLMKYEEGVVPMGEREGEAGSNYNYR